MSHQMINMAKYRGTVTSGVYNYVRHLRSRSSSSHDLLSPRSVDLGFLILRHLRSRNGPSRKSSDTFFCATALLIVRAGFFPFSSGRHGSLPLHVAQCFAGAGASRLLCHSNAIESAARHAPTVFRERGVPLVFFSPYTRATTEKSGMIYQFTHLQN